MGSAASASRSSVGHRRGGPATATGRRRCARPRAVPQLGTRALAVWPARMSSTRAGWRPCRGPPWCWCLLDGDRALGVLAHGQAGHAQRGGLLPQTARIGEHQRGGRTSGPPSRGSPGAAASACAPDRSRRRPGRSARCWRGARVQREHQRQAPRTPGAARRAARQGVGHRRRWTGGGVTTHQPRMSQHRGVEAVCAQGIGGDCGRRALAAGESIITLPAKQMRVAASTPSRSRLSSGCARWCTGGRRPGRSAPG